MNETRVLLLGTPCPLCGSSGCLWVGEVDHEITDKIRHDFPKWRPEAGICERCIEAYTPPRLI